MAKQNLKNYLVTHFYTKIESDLNRFLIECNPNDYGLHCPSMDFSLHDFFVQEFDILALWADSLPDERVRLYLKVETKLHAETIMYDRLCGEIPISDDINPVFILEYTASPILKFEDFQLCEVYDSDYEPEFNLQLTSQLVPFFPNNELESMAEMVLSAFYPEALDGSCAVDIQVLAKRAGLRVCWGNFDRSDLHGVIYFKDCNRLCWDSIEAMKTAPAPNASVTNGTALINAELYDSHNHSRAWTAISHEVIHWLFDRKAMYLRMLLYNSKPYLNVMEENTAKNPNNAREWMEYHADKLAPRILMPYHATLAKAHELYEAYIHENPSYDSVAIQEKIIKTLADFYNVSYEMAKYRMDEIGFTSAKGIMVWVDDHYIPNFKTSNGKFEKYDRYHLTNDQLFDICRKYPDIKDSLWNGDYLFVENHIVLNDILYVTRGGDGQLQLTDFARNNIDLCALRFKMEITPNENSGWPYFYKLYKLQQESRYYYDLAYNQNVKLTHLTASQRAIASYEKEKEFVDNMPKRQALNYCFEQCGAKVTEVANELGISREHLSRAKNGNRHPSFDLVLACGVVLNIPKKAYSPLLMSYGYNFIHTDERHDFLQFLINGFSECGLLEWNRCLYKKGYEPIPEPWATIPEYRMILEDESTTTNYYRN